MQQLKEILFSTITLVFLAVVIILAMTGNSGPRVLGKAVVSRRPTLSPIPTTTPQLTPTPNSFPSSTPAPLLITSPVPLSPTPTTSADHSLEQIHALIELYAAEYGLDPSVLRHLAVCESGFNPLAKNGPYWGLYQFAAASWISNRTVMGEDPCPDLRLEAEAAIKTAAFLLSQGRRNLWPSCLPE